jgi:hypothetical protein
LGAFLSPPPAERDKKVFPAISMIYNFESQNPYFRILIESIYDLREAIAISKIGIIINDTENITLCPPH